MNFKPFRSVRDVNPVQSLNASVLVLSKDFGNVKAVSPLQSSNDGFVDDF